MGESRSTCESGLVGGLRLRIHPLFLIVGIVYAIFGKITVFIVYTLSALLHEIGHSLVAENLGYSLNKITLMPFGAVVSGNVAGLRALDQIKIALAGPLLNLAIAFLFIAFWWIIPETYAVTYIVVEANLALCFVNLIPLLPLDGGRILNSILSIKFSPKIANRICTATGIILASSLLGLFVYSLFTTPNISLLFFSLFALLGTLEKKNNGKYVKIYCALSADRLKRGMKVKIQAIDVSMKLKKVLSLLDAECVNEIHVYSNGKVVAILSQAELSEILQTGDLYSPIARYLPS